jgi:hypothetical protein
MEEEMFDDILKDIFPETSRSLIIVFKTAKKLVPKVMEIIDQDFSDLPDEPLLKGNLCKYTLQLLVTLILEDMRHPDITRKSLIDQFCRELKTIALGERHGD